MTVQDKGKAKIYSEVDLFSSETIFKDISSYGKLFFLSLPICAPLLLSGEIRQMCL